MALLHSGGSGMVELCTDPAESLTIAPEAVDGAFAALGQFLARHRDRRCIGWLGYDLRDDVEPIGRRIVDDLALPVLHFSAYDRVLRWPRMPVPAPPPVDPATRMRAHESRAAYESRVARVVEHIRAGDIFQANLTQPFTGSFDGDPRLLFWKLCHRSPAPFAAYIEAGDGTAVISASPEEFLALDGQSVRTRPIKGTRPRQIDPIADRDSLRELLASAKDRAELAMIVDLMRNDLGKVCEIGSVAVERFPEHDSFAQVHHLFATVTGQLRAEVDMIDLLRATFPAGSITGAPKQRCMEILEELELVRRGVYTGAIGWIGPGSNLHLNVAIRTMVVKDGVVRCNAGGGITARSDPATEYEETLHKASGMFRALDAEVELP